MNGRAKVQVNLNSAARGEARQRWLADQQEDRRGHRQVAAEQHQVARQAVADEGGAGRPGDAHQGGDGEYLAAGAGTDPAPSAMAPMKVQTPLRLI